MRSLFCFRVRGILLLTFVPRLQLLYAGEFWAFSAHAITYSTCFPVQLWMLLIFFELKRVYVFQCSSSCFTNFLRMRRFLCVCATAPRFNFRWRCFSHCSTWFRRLHVFPSHAHVFHSLRTCSTYLLRLRNYSTWWKCFSLYCTCFLLHYNMPFGDLYRSFIVGHQVLWNILRTFARFSSFASFAPRICSHSQV